MRHGRVKIAAALPAVLKAIALGGALANGVLHAAQPQAVDWPILEMGIPAQPLASALRVFAEQTGLQVLYVSSLVTQQRSHAVTAGARANRALARLLEGTGLRFEILTAGSVRILESAPQPFGPPPAASTESQSSLQEVIVTGSRIAAPLNISVASPLQIVTAQDIVLTGHTDAVDVLSALPQFVTSATGDFGNYSNPVANAGGIATADLRGLGPQRTVVLINGKRLGLGDPSTGNPNPAPDVDQIPLAMVERIEVLTGGASATYGSDAIGGVVNFILKDRVQGVQVDAQYGFEQHSQQNYYIQAREVADGIVPPTGTAIDGFRRNLSMLAGTDFHDGAGNVTAYFIYHGQNPVYGSERDFADCPAVSNNALTGVSTQGGFTCVGSMSNVYVTSAGDVYSVVGNQFVPYPAPGSIPPAHFNYSSYDTAQRHDRRYQAGLETHIDLDEAIRPYLELSFMDDYTLTQLAPSGLFVANDYLNPNAAYLVNCSNPLLSSQEAAILCTPTQIAADKTHPGSVNAVLDISRRNIEGPGRVESYEHRNYRAVGGVNGKLGDAWSYDAYVLYYYTSLFHANENYLNYAAINKALEVTTGPSGQAVCISGGNCVPYDIFKTGGVTPRQLAYLYIEGTDSGANSEQIIEANVTGQLGRYGLIAPWSHRGIAVNAGIERRSERLQFAPDTAEQSPDLAGYGGAAVQMDQSVSVDEAYVEVRAPIAEDRPLTKNLSIDGGYRYSSYSTAGATNTFKIDLQFAPISDLQLRSSFDRVVRAPNLIELYTPLSYGVSAVSTDPCAPTNGGATRAAASLAECMHTGVTAQQYGNGFGPAVGGTSTIPQCVEICGAVGGGNLQLAPEVADTWSSGLTLTPTSLPVFTASFDYFHILLHGEIGTIPTPITLQQCLVTGDPSWCSEIVRTAAGALSGSSVAGGGYILQRNANTGAALVSGIDTLVNLRQPLAPGWGALAVSLTGTWLQHNSSTPYRSAPSYDCAGLFGSTCLNGSVNPTWRHNLRVTWQTPWNLQLSAQWRYIGRTSFDNNSPQPFLQNQEEGFFDPVLAHIPAYSYLDLTLIWAVTPHLQAQAGVSNLFDKDPPFLPSDVSIAAGGINTFPIYDLLGRSVDVALRATF